MRTSFLSLFLLILSAGHFPGQCEVCSEGDEEHCVWDVTSPATPLTPPTAPWADLGGSSGGGSCQASAAATGGVVEGCAQGALPPSTPLVQEKCQASDSGYGGSRVVDTVAGCTCNFIEENLLLSVYVEASALFSGTAHTNSRIEVMVDCDWISTLESKVETNADVILKAITGTTGTWGYSFQAFTIGWGMQSGPNPYTQSPVPFSQTITSLDGAAEPAAFSEVDGIGIIHFIVDMSHADSTLESAVEGKVNSFSFQAVWHCVCSTCGTTASKNYILP